MKSWGWILAGAGAACAAYLILSSPALQCPFESDGAGRAANRISFWGAKQRVTGTAAKVAGKVKEGLGNLTGDDELSAKGTVDQATGAVKDVAGKAANAAGGAIRDLG